MSGVVGSSKYARIPIEPFPKCGERIVAILHQKKSAQLMPFVMKPCSL